MCRQFKIHGRVQGVFFRASTRDVAAARALSGHALNLPDSCVEVLACGEDAAIEELLDWLRRGPPMASVSAVDETETDCLRPTGFRIG